MRTVSNHLSRKIKHWVQHSRLDRVEEEIEAVKNLPVGLFTNPEAMSIHQEIMVKLLAAKEAIQKRRARNENLPGGT